MFEIILNHISPYTLVSGIRWWRRRRENIRKLFRRCTVSFNFEAGPTNLRRWKTPRWWHRIAETCRSWHLVGSLFRDLFIVFEFVHFLVFKNMDCKKMYVYLCLYNTLSWMCVCVCVRAYGLVDPQVHFARMWDKTTKFKFIIFTVANVQRAIKSWTYIQFANYLIVLRFFFRLPTLLQNFLPFMCKKRRTSKADKESSYCGKFRTKAETNGHAGHSKYKISIRQKVLPTVFRERISVLYISLHVGHIAT